MPTINDTQQLIDSAADEAAWARADAEKANKRADDARKAADYWRQRAEEAERSEREMANEAAINLMLYEQAKANAQPACVSNTHRWQFQLVRALTRHRDAPGSADAELLAIRDEMVGWMGRGALDEAINRPEE